MITFLVLYESLEFMDANEFLMLPAGPHPSSGLQLGITQGFQDKPI